MGLLFLLSAITYIDRVCISVAGPRMQADLGISPSAWGWVTGAFAFSYALFEIPTGALGDRLGPRSVLTRIVLWWSAFTSFTGMVSSYPLLLIIRFCFGMGEAGAFPVQSVAVSRWFPVPERGRTFGILWSAGQLGGAFAPLIVVPIQMRYGWRASFYTFGVVGVIWALVWYRWFRDSPRENEGVSEAEREEIGDLAPKTHSAMPWGVALRTVNLWAIMGMAFSYLYPYYFFQSWFHTYLEKGRGFSESSLWLSALPFMVGACCNVCGGLASKALVTRFGLTWGRRAIGMIGLGCAAIFTIATLLTHDRTLSLVFLSLLYGGITFQQPVVFAVCLDVGGVYAGAVTGAMNSAGQVGSLVSSVVFGYLVDHYANYDLPFIPMAIFLLVGTLLWIKIDASRVLIPTTQSAIPAPVA